MKKDPLEKLFDSIDSFVEKYVPPLAITGLLIMLIRTLIGV